MTSPELSSTNIPMVDLVAAHHEIAAEVEAGFQKILTTGGFVGGPEVTAFEQEYAAAHGVAHCVGLASGTDAVEFALRAVGVETGDEVVIPANTFVATAEAIHRIGARVVLADMDPDTYLIDVAGALRATSEKTRAIVPVHLFGQLAPVEEIRAGIASSDVSVVEDAAQCQGATRHGQAAGVGGTAATSFYPGKNLGAYGDAGAVVTDDAAVERQLRLLGNHGGIAKYEHEVVGYNSRLDPLQATVLRAKLRRLRGWNEARRRVATRYEQMLADLPIALPKTLEGNEHVWHLYVVRLDEADSRERRDEVVRSLNAAGIGAGVHYPRPVHLTPAFEHLGYAQGSFPNAEYAADRILSLPMHPHLTEAQQDRVVEELRRALSNA